MSIFKKVLSVGSGKLAQELNKKVELINLKEPETEKLTDQEIKNNVGSNLSALAQGILEGFHQETS